MTLVGAFFYLKGGFMIQRPIPGCPGYFVTNKGDVYSYRKNRKHIKMKPYKGNKLGYLKIDFRKNKVGKQLFIHQIVYTVFHGQMPEGHHVHHKDGNFLNNHMDNLEALHPMVHSHLHHSKGEEKTWELSSNTDHAPTVGAAMPLLSTKITARSAFHARSRIKATPAKRRSGQKKTTQKQMSLFLTEAINPLRNVDLALLLAKSLTTEWRSSPVLLCKLLVTLIRRAILLDNIYGSRPKTLRGLAHSGKLAFGGNLFGSHLEND